MPPPTPRVPPQAVGCSGGFQTIQEYSPRRSRDKRQRLQNHRAEAAMPFSNRNLTL